MSKGTEEKKNIEWLKGRLRMRKLFKPQNDREIGYNMAIDEFSEYVDQLDDTEVIPNEVEEEQKYYVVKSEGLDGVHYYFRKFDDEMNGLFTLPNDKKRAYRFDDKEKAQAIVSYVGGRVEEWEE